MSKLVPLIYLIPVTAVVMVCSLMGAGWNVARAEPNAAPQQSLFGDVEQYAELADAAYEPKATVDKTLTKYGYTLDDRGNLPGPQVTYYLATDDSKRRQLVAVRGTINVENALVDIDIQLIDDPKTGIRLHRGFAAAAASIYDALKSKINKDYQIVTTGHSLGGAIALILAMYLDTDHYNVEKVVTFGQPKVTNITGAEKFSHLNVWRVVTAHDLVPVVPPLDPMDIKNLDIYWHLGQEIILLDGAKYSITQGLESMLRATGFLNQQLNRQNLQYHRMTSYLTSIGRKQDKAQWVPYKNDFNIFSIFGGNGANNDDKNNGGGAQ